MACKFCGWPEGGYECPICFCDYCKDCYEKHVTRNWGNPHEIIHEVCQLCGDEL